LAVAADGLDLDLPERDVRLVEAHVEAGRLVFADGDRVRGGLEADGRDGERVAAGRDADREAAVVLRRRPGRGAGDEHGRAGDRGAAALGDAPLDLAPVRGERGGGEEEEPEEGEGCTHTVGCGAAGWRSRNGR